MDKKHIASIWYFVAAFLILTALQVFQEDRFLSTSCEDAGG